MMAAANFDDPTSTIDASTATVIERVRRAIDRAQAAPIVAAEEHDGEDLAPIRREVLGALDEASEALAAVLARYEQPTEEPELDWDFGDRPSTVCRVVEDKLDADSGATRITGVAFVARLAIRGRRESVLSVPVERKWDLIAGCSSAVREILKSLSAVEIAIAAHEGFVPTTRYYVSELERSLRVRRAYHTFRAEVLGDGPPITNDAARRLRSAASAIAKLISREAYGHARVHDRSSLRALQRRIREQLTAHALAHANPETSEDALAMLDVAAGRLWQDLANLAELMLLINNRAELRDHDRAMLETTRSALASGAMDVDAARGALRDTLGRAPEIDRFLLGRRDCTAAEIQTLIDAALAMLGPAVESEERPGDRRRQTDSPTSTN